MQESININLTDGMYQMPKPHELKGGNIALFGSSANPPTVGHFRIVEYLHQNENFDEIWVMPVYTHIFKKTRKFESYDDRLLMCKNSFEQLSTGRCVVRVVPVELLVFHSDPSFVQGTARAGTSSCFCRPNSRACGSRWCWAQTRTTTCWLDAGSDLRSKSSVFLSMSLSV